MCSRGHWHKQKRIRQQITTPGLLENYVAENFKNKKSNFTIQSEFFKDKKVRIYKKKEFSRFFMNSLFHNFTTCNFLQFLKFLEQFSSEVLARSYI